MNRTNEEQIVRQLASALCNNLSFAKGVIVIVISNKDIISGVDAESKDDVMQALSATLLSYKNNEEFLESEK